MYIVLASTKYLGVLQLSILEICYFVFRFEFKKTQIKILNRSLGYVKETQLKLLIEEVNEIVS
jgi:hypothetical protein